MPPSTTIPVRVLAWMLVPRLSPANVPFLILPNRSTTRQSFSTRVSITQEFCPPTRPSAAPAPGRRRWRPGAPGENAAVTARPTRTRSGCRFIQSPANWNRYSLRRRTPHASSVVTRRIRSSRSSGTMGRPSGKRSPSQARVRARICSRDVSCTVLDLPPAHRARPAGPYHRPPVAGGGPAGARERPPPAAPPGVPGGRRAPGHPGPNGAPAPNGASRAPGRGSRAAAASRSR